MLKLPLVLLLNCLLLLLLPLRVPRRVEEAEFENPATAGADESHGYV